MGIKFLRGIRRTRVGIDEEDNNPLKETHLELSINQEHGGVPNQRIGEHLSTQSHAENQRNASGSENAGPTNESIKEMSSSQNIKESEESVAEYGNTVPPNKMTEDNLSSLNITGSNQAENTMQNVETIVQYESSSEVTENNEAVMDKGDDNNTGQGIILCKNIIHRFKQYLSLYNQKYIFSFIFRSAIDNGLISNKGKSNRDCIM